MNNIQLTIAIPTYNRKNNLKNQLNKLSKSLYEMSEEESSKVEILIANNCSTDGTEKLLKNIDKQYNKLNIRHHKHIENIGFDGNINYLYKNAKAQFVWFLSDDDNFCCNTIDSILNIISNNNDLSLIILNTYENPLRKDTIIDVVQHSPIGITLTLAVGKKNISKTKKKEWL